MSVEEPRVGPVQILIVGFETTERFRGEVARELLDLRGRGMIRVLDARLLQRGREGELTEVDVGPVLADRPSDVANPVSGLLGLNGVGGNGGRRPQEALERTAGFALEDLRRLADEIGPGDHALAILVEHVWAARLRTAVRDAGGRLVGQGFLTPEVVMLVGAEIQARADAEAAIELAHAARASALVEALSVLSDRRPGSSEQTTRAAAEVVRVLVTEGFVERAEAPAAIDALATAGLIEAALFQAAVAEAEATLDDRLGADPD
jgi:hypothetical protein